jgi:hypothetical protein
MSKTNLILGGVLAVIIVIWAVQRSGKDEGVSAAAPRLFPEFNREAADGIRMEGGWKGIPYEFEKSGAGWTMRSGGGFPVKGEEISTFMAAVANLRRDNFVGDSAALKKTSRTGSLGRKITILRGGEPMASFVVGKHPTNDWRSYFIRRSDEEKIYRTKTVNKNAPAANPTPSPFPGMGGTDDSFDWAQYSNNAYKWASTQIWNLDDGEVREAWLERPGDGFNVQLKKKEEGAWTIKEEGKEDAVKADTSAVEDITGSLSYLAFEEVVGNFSDDEARAKYGLDKPVITLVLTLRKKVEPKAAAKKPDGEEGAEKEAEAEAEPQYETIRRTVTVGNKVKLPRSYNDEKGEAEEREFYAIKVSGDLADPTKSDYIFLVDDFKIGPLKKSLEDLVLKEEPKEEEPKDDAPKDDEPKDDEPKGDEPKGDEPKGDEPKGDEPKGDEPKGDEPKGDEPKGDEPKGDEPKGDEPKGDEPKADEPKADEPKADEPKGDEPNSK